MAISRTMTFYELKKPNGKVVRAMSRSLLENLKGVGDSITDMVDVRTAISDDDFLNTASFRILRDKDGNVIYGKRGEAAGDDVDEATIA